MIHHFVKIVFSSLIIGCTPLYNSKHTNNPNFEWVIQSDDYLEQYKLENYLKIHSCALNSQKKLYAKINLNLTFDPIAYSMDITIARYTGIADVNLKLYLDNQLLLDKNIKILSSYNANQEFEAVCSKEAAKERLLQSVALSVIKEIAVAIK